jgi:hypothetical protein
MARQKHLISLANAVFMAMAYEATIRPIVEGYEREILAHHRWTNRGALERAKGKPYEHEIKEEVILEPNLSYNLSDEDFLTYLAECEIEMRKAGLTAEKDCCPLLVAERLKIEAQWAFVDALEPYTGIERGSLFFDGCKSYEKYIELNLKLFADKVKGLAA